MKEKERAAKSEGASVDAAAEIAGEAAGAAVVHSGGSEQEAVSAARQAAHDAGGSAEAEAKATAATHDGADARHRGHYEGAPEGGAKAAGGRIGSLVHDAASVGAPTAAAGGT